MDVRLQDDDRTPTAGFARAWPLWLCASASVILLLTGPADPVTFPLPLALGLAVIAAAVLVAFWVVGSSGRAATRAFRPFANDPGIVMLSDPTGLILRRTDTARGLSDAGAVEEVIGTWFADPTGVMHSLLGALRDGDSAVRRSECGGHLTEVTVHLAERELLVWRVVRRRHAERATAVPVVGLSPGGTILWRNAAAESLIGADLPRLDGEMRQPGLSGRTPAGPFDLAEFSGPDGERQVCLMPTQAARGTALEHGLFDSLPIPLLRLGPGGEIERANGQAADLLGQTDLMGVRLGDVVRGLGRGVGDWIDAALAGRGLNRPETVEVAQARKETHVRISLARILTPDGPRVIAALNDATELKTLEAQFVQSQKMQAIGQLAGGIAHDFNNLLTAISGHCDLMRLRRTAEDPDWSDLQQVSENTERAAALVRQLLAFSRKQTLELSQLDLRGTLSNLTCLLDRLVGERVSIAYDHDPDLSRVRGDDRQMEQVLMNLVVNARDAMAGQGGEISIKTRNQLLAQPLDREVVEIPAGRYVVIEVADQGPGIPSDLLPKIFEPFFTTKAPGKGTGLGLSTVYGIVKQSDGFIFADPRPGGGTVFSLWFPAALDGPRSKAHLPNSTSAEPAPATVSERPDRPRVLLCEDEAPVRAFAARALTLKGFEVIEADCGEAALTALDGMDAPPDILVSDVIMPGLGGPEWTRRALEVHPGIPVVFMSGYTEGALDDLPPDALQTTFLAKPFSLDALISAVQDALGDRD